MDIGQQQQHSLSQANLSMRQDLGLGRSRVRGLQININFFMNAFFIQASIQVSPILFVLPSIQNKQNQKYQPYQTKQ